MAEKKYTIIRLAARQGLSGPGGGGSGGAVDSVNGKTGAVELDASDIPAATNKNYVSNEALVVLGNTSGTNTGDQTNIPGASGTVNTINGRIAAGANVTITGQGSADAPYIINASGGGGGGVAWGAIAGNIGDQADLTSAIAALVTKSTTINGHTLSDNIALTTTDIAEGSNEYFTSARAIAAPLTGYSSGAGTVSAADTILSAIGKISGNVALLAGADVFQGLWNASTNSPALASGVGTKGFMYKVSVAGTTNLDGITQWNVGDQAIFDGTTWDKLHGSPNEVLSVNGAVGAVVLTTDNITEGTNKYWTVARTIGSAITGFAAAAGTVLATDTIVQAFDKVVGNITSLATTVANLTTASIAASTNKNYVTDTELAALAALPSFPLSIANGGTGGNGTINTQTASYTFVLADEGNLVKLNSASAIVGTVPTNATVAFPLLSTIIVVQYGAGAASIAAAAGVTIHTTSTLNLTGQYGIVQLTKIGADEWLAVGNFQ